MSCCVTGTPSIKGFFAKIKQRIAERFHMNFTPDAEGKLTVTGKNQQIVPLEFLPDSFKVKMKCDPSPSPSCNPPHQNLVTARIKYCAIIEWDVDGVCEIHWEAKK